MLKVIQLVNGRYFSSSLELFYQLCSTVRDLSPRNTKRAINVQIHPLRKLSPRGCSDITHACPEKYFSVLFMPLSTSPVFELVQAWLSSLSGLMYVTFFDLDSDYFLIFFLFSLVTESVSACYCFLIIIT